MPDLRLISEYAAEATEQAAKALAIADRATDPETREVLNALALDLVFIAGRRRAELAAAVQAAESAAARTAAGVGSAAA